MSGRPRPDHDEQFHDGGRPPLALPPKVPRQPQRPTQASIPPGHADRRRVRDAARQRVAADGLVPPLGKDDLRDQAEQVCRLADVGLDCTDYAAVMVNNETWRDTLARIPFERRLLLLPKCLRSSEQCPAPIDEFGLVCQQCGQCAINELQAEAEDLGYAILVAEGSTLVTRMIEGGQIEAIVGVSCMNVLALCFPHMEARAVPALAIPLLQDGCQDTTVDLDWVREAINLTSADRTYLLDLETLKRDVQAWFDPRSLADVMGTPEAETERIARDWLARAGKRWRPYLTACVADALRRETGETPAPPSVDSQPRTPPPAELRRLAVAVECFHKASLIHDDIEDGDDQRYGQKALHVEYGTPVALNVGDFLLGEGYRLIGELDVDDAAKVAMLRIAAAGHLTLSRGQGAELCWARRPAPLTPLEVLDIFRQKTTPAFEVALRLGACLVGAGDEVHEVLARYSEALGIAYQIRDDLEDFAALGDSDDLLDPRPSLILAITHKRAADESERELTAALWNREAACDKLAADVYRLAERRGVIETAENLLEAYLAQATRSLRPLKSASLKGLLRRVIGRIFQDRPMRGYCREFEGRHAAGRTVGPEPAA